MRSPAKYYEILTRKGLRYAVHELWRKLSPRTYYPYIYRYLERQYAQYIVDFEVPEQQIPRVIWIFWMQGIEQAPSLVQACVESVRRYAPDFEVRVLDEHTIHDYVTIPPIILHRLEHGQMSRTSFSDYLRVSLLAEHGGIWMDATVLMTAPMPDYVTQSNLFLYQTPVSQRIVHIGSSWFLAAAPGHPFMVNVRDLLVCYWRRERSVCDYFLVHDLMALVANRSQHCQYAISMMPLVTNDAPHALDPETFRVTPIHKLSYKSPLPPFVQKNVEILANLKKKL